MLKVLLQNRPDARDRPGGDTVVMDRTAAYLSALGHEVDVSLAAEVDLAGYDLVHLFNLTRPFEARLQARNARRQARPYVLSPIYWDLHRGIPWSAYEFPRSWRVRMTPLALRRRLDRRLLFRDVRRVQAEVARGARLLFPGTDAEREHLVATLGHVPADRLRVVPHGVAPLPGGSAPGGALPEVAGAFLCAGGIGPRKNQLGLVKAFRELPGERLAIVGDASPGCERYLRAVRRAAGPNVAFHPSVPHEHMGRLLAEARVFVQPSFVETPGLAAMEAAAAGLPLVLTEFAPVREYFGAGERTHYCDPTDARSVVRACRQALRGERAGGDEFQRRFDWGRMLAPLGEAYTELEREAAARVQAARSAPGALVLGQGGAA